MPIPPIPSLPHRRGRTRCCLPGAIMPLRYQYRWWRNPKSRSDMMSRPVSKQRPIIEQVGYPSPPSAENRPSKGSETACRRQEKAGKPSGDPETTNDLPTFGTCSVQAWPLQRSQQNWIVPDLTSTPPCKRRRSTAALDRLGMLPYPDALDWISWSGGQSDGEIVRTQASGERHRT